MMDIAKILSSYPEMTDLHVTEGSPVMIRMQGNLKKLRDMGDGTFFDSLLDGMNEKQQNDWGEKGAFDSSLTIGEGRLRIHVYRAGGKRAAAVRFLPSLSSLPPDPDEGWIEKIAALDHGLVLVTGPSGSGKSTTLARIIDTINGKRPCHIITLEDPIEYEIPSKKALLHQREIGLDTDSFASGIRESLREDPDVIALGELRDGDTVTAALTAAETGHLVLATLHTTRAADSIGRLIHACPKEKEEEARNLITANLVSIASQKLCRSGKETFLLREILTNIPAVSHLIKEGKDEQIPSYMEMGLHDMRTMKQAIYSLRNISEREREKLLKTLV